MVLYSWYATERLIRELYNDTTEKNISVQEVFITEKERAIISCNCCVCRNLHRCLLHTK